MPGRSKVRSSDGAETLTWLSGRMPRMPRNVSAHMLEPYARYSTVLGLAGPVGWKDFARIGSLGNGVGATSGSESRATEVQGMDAIEGYGTRFGRAAQDQRIW